MIEGNENNKGVAKVEQGNSELSTFSSTGKLELLGLQYDTVDELQAILALAIKGKAIACDNVGQAFAIALQAQRLNIDIVTASNHIHDVNGKSGIDVHIIKALLIRAGVTWTLVHDYAPTYEYKSIDNIVYHQDRLPSNSVITTCKEDVDKATADGKLALYPIFDSNGRQLVYDYVTTYKFSRYLRNSKGELYEKIVTSTFTYSDAVRAKLGYNKSGTLDVNSPWFKYPNLMTDHRTFTFGARDIASDILLGLPEVTELAEVESVNYNMNDGEVTIID